MSTFNNPHNRRIQRKAFQTNSNRTKSQNIEFLTIETESNYDKPVLTENISPKSMIFYLAIRKAYKNTSFRYMKFAFYLIRSLFKELQLLPRNSSSRRKSLGLMKKKEFLSKTLAAYKSNQATNKLRRFFSFCKEITTFKEIKRGLIERFSRVCYKRLLVAFKLFSRNLQPFCDMKAQYFIKLIGRIIIARISSKIKENRIVTIIYSVLIKPRHNLPLIKTEKIAAIRHKDNQNKSPTPRSTYLQQFRHKIKRNNNLNDRAIFHMQLFNKHYCYIRRLVFKRMHDYYRAKKVAEYLVKRAKAIDLLKNLLTCVFTDIINQMITRCSKSLTLIWQEQNETKINMKELVFFGKLLADVICNKKFSAFMHIKNYVANGKRIKFMSANIRCFVKTLKELLLFSREKRVKEAFNILKDIHVENIHKENFCYLSKILKEINLKNSFLNYLSGFNSLKLWAIYKHKLDLRKGSKLLFVLNKQYNKLTALGFM